MKNATLLIERSIGETRAALLYGKEVWQVEHFRDNQKPLLGGIYTGRIRRIDQTMNAAFVDIGQKQDGFLRARDAIISSSKRKRANISQLVHEGQFVTAKVTAEGFSGKGPRLVLNIDEVIDTKIKSTPSCIKPPPGAVDSILQTYSKDLLQIVCNDLVTKTAVQNWLDINIPQNNLTLIQENGPLFITYGVEEALTLALSHRVAVNDGAELVFDQTETLCAIDVNSSRQMGKAGRGPRDINLSVVKEIARQLRLRSIGGAIVIDALKMNRANDRNQVLESLRNYISGDPSTSHVLGISNLGLIEMTRTRIGSTLAERMLEPCDIQILRSDVTAYNVIRHLLSESRVYPSASYVLKIAPEVEEILAGKLNIVFTEAANKVGRVELQGMPNWSRERCELIPIN
jgi:Ribonuclease G/E